LEFFYDNFPLLLRGHGEPQEVLSRYAELILSQSVSEERTRLLVWMLRNPIATGKALQYAQALFEKLLAARAFSLADEIAEMIRSLAPNAPKSYWNLCFTAVKAANEEELVRASVALMDIPAYSKYLTLVSGEEFARCAELEKRQCWYHTLARIGADNEGDVPFAAGPLCKDAEYLQYKKTVSEARRRELDRLEQLQQARRKDLTKRILLRCAFALLALLIFTVATLTLPLPVPFVIEGVLLLAAFLLDVLPLLCGRYAFYVRLHRTAYFRLPRGERALKKYCLAYCETLRYVSIPDILSKVGLATAIMSPSSLSESSRYIILITEA
jgi:hypothetical protein